MWGVFAVADTGLGEPSLRGVTSVSASLNRATSVLLFRSRVLHVRTPTARRGNREGFCDCYTETSSSDIRFRLHPPAEQAAIVRFLDWANGRLERAIRAKRKVIALLNEQKQAIIHRAVTRGLDPSVPLKPSGIPWLGDIPQHWEVMKLRCDVLQIEHRRQRRSRRRDYWDQSVLYPRNRNVRLRSRIDGRILDQRWISSTELRLHDDRPETVILLVCRGWDNGVLGVVAFWDEHECAVCGSADSSSPSDRSTLTFVVTVYSSLRPGATCVESQWFATAQQTTILTERASNSAISDLRSAVGRAEADC